MVANKSVSTDESENQKEACHYCWRQRSDPSITNLNFLQLFSQIKIFYIVYLLAK
jgi:hypothetical protein